MIDTATQYVSDQFARGLGNSWSWFNSLSREEWIIVLGACCLLGFLLIRGFGSKRPF